MQYKVKNLKHARGKLRKIAHAFKEKSSLKVSFYRHFSTYIPKNYIIQILQCSFKLIEIQIWIFFLVFFLGQFFFNLALLY